MPPIHKGQFGLYYLFVTTKFEDTCKQAATKFHRFQDVYGRLRAVITADPGQRGTVQPLDDGLYVSDKDPAARLPGMRIRYRYHDNRLIFLEIQVW